MNTIGPDIFKPLVYHYFPEPHASLFMGMLLGVPLKSTKNLYNDMKVVGLTHLIVLSGTNITILASIITSFTLHFGKRLSSLITILIIGIFVIFVGPQAPIVRAALMSICTLVANITGRKSISIYILLCSLIIIIMIWPDWLGTISLQLSYGASLGLIIFGRSSPLISEKKLRMWDNFILYLKEELRLSIAAQIFTAPIIFYYFRQISVIAPISNIVISWTIAPLMFMGMTTIILGSFHPIFGEIPAFLCYGLLTYIIGAADSLAKVPFIFFSF